MKAGEDCLRVAAGELAPVRRKASRRFEDVNKTAASCDAPCDVFGCA